MLFCWEHLWVLLLVFVQDKWMSLKLPAAKRKRSNIVGSYSPVPPPSNGVKYAEASTQTEEEYTDDDYYSCFLKPVSDSYDCETQTHFKNIFYKSPVEVEPSIEPAHCRVLCEEQEDLQLYEDHSDPPKRVKCSICNKWFSSVSSFIQHKSVHTGERPYECEFCHKTFRQQGNLASHRRTHIGLKPYKCDICDKRFANSSNVVVHKRTHTGEKPFECDICYKRFSQFAHLVGHKRTHTGEAPFQCNICQKRFNNPSNLTTHKRIHIGDRPYQCDICNKTFKQSGHLSSHKKSHVEKQQVTHGKVSKKVTPDLAKQCSVSVKCENQSWWI